MPPLPRSNRLIPSLEKFKQKEMGRKRERITITITDFLKNVQPDSSLKDVPSSHLVAND